MTSYEKSFLNLSMHLSKVPAYYTSSNGRIVTAITTNDPLTSIQQGDPISVMYAASLFKTFEESLGPTFEAYTIHIKEKPMDQFK